MSGGNRIGSRYRSARRLATGLLGGLLAAPCNVDALYADDQMTDDAMLAAATASDIPSPADDCGDRPREQSIVARSAKLAEEGVIMASDQPADGLEPIANVSEYEPELADESTSTAPKEPTLADETAPTVVASDAPDAPDVPEATAKAEIAAASPIVDDVCEEDAAATATDGPACKIEAASFNGVTPGLTTRSEVAAQWGQPAEGGPADDTQTYNLESFPAVTITFVDDLVDSVCIQLAKPAPAAQLIDKLGLAGLRPATIQDSTGAVACTKFPERGVVLNHAATGPAAQDESLVSKIVIESINATAFIERAESSPVRDYGNRIVDLETALELDGKSDRARLMLADLKLTIGEAVAAEKLAADAVDLAPRSDEYRLVWARCLKYLARYDEAVEQTRKVLEGTTASQVVRAQALEQMGLLAALGNKEIQEQAIPLHNKAIDMADQLAKSEDPAIRAVAHQLLVSAHLAVAERVAVGDWQHKRNATEQWLNRASALSEEMIAAGEADVSLRLQVALAGLRAGGRLNPPVDPAPWIAEAEEAAADLQSQNPDPLACEEINWQLGMAYFYATEIQHRRSQAESALKYGDLAREKLAPLAEDRRELPDTDFALGRLYFQIGAVYAVHHHDHDLACQWYDRASEPLMKPVPVTALAGPAAHGDALVSMGVSYWEVGVKDRAYELTEAGLELVQQGVDEGLLAAEALDVPQGNLKAMAKALGKIPSEPEVDAEEDDTRLVRNGQSNGQRANRTPAGRKQSQVANRSRNDASMTRRR